MLFIAGDIGGTNARLELVRASAAIAAHDFERGKGEVTVAEATYPSLKYDTLEEVIQMFITKYKPANEQIYCMCLAVAGPVTNNIARITNLKWVIDGDALARQFRLSPGSVKIINDFVGNGRPSQQHGRYGLLALDSSDLQLIKAAKTGPSPRQSRQGVPEVKAVIGAGTGLGECFLTNHNAVDAASGDGGGAQGGWEVCAAEGGHTDFAPRNQQEWEIMQHIIAQSRLSPNKDDWLDRVSTERVVSGLGLPKIYSYLAAKRGDGNPAVSAAIAAPDADIGRIIGDAAHAQSCPVCVETMSIFVSSYGAEAGNLCLKLLPFSGLYIAGGIAAKNMAVMMRDDQFVRSFLDKGRMKEVLQRVPIYLITHKAVGLLGSKVICRRTLHAAATKKKIVSKL